MTEQSQDFEMWAGEYKELTIAILKPDGTPEDLTGPVTVVWVVKKRLDVSLPALLSKSSGHGAEVLVPPTAGLVKVTLGEADTQALAGTYYHETEGRDSADRPFTPTVGYLVIQPSAIRG
jgi:hypothetical protein